MVNTTASISFASTNTGTDALPIENILYQTNVLVTDAPGATLTAIRLYSSPIAAIWAPTDLSRFTPASAPVLAASVLATARPTAGSRSPQRASSEPTTTSTQFGNAKSSENLSTGGKICIGIGVPAVVCLVAALMFFLRRRRRGRVSPNPDHPYLDAKAELHGKEKQRADLGDDGNVRELGGRNNPLELEGVPQRHELQGNVAGQEMTTISSPLIRGAHDIFILMSFSNRFEKQRKQAKPFGLCSSRIAYRDGDSAHFVSLQRAGV